MRLTSVAATVLGLFIPSRSVHISMGKLALIGMMFTTFFLFTAGYHFPGGASHYPNWAEAIVHGTKLPFDLAQREVGFPLLYILSGFTITHSFIGITLIFAIFAVLMAVLVYVCLVSISPRIAFYIALACILSLSPYTYLKFFYPDEAYMFFNLLAATFLITFIQSKGNFRLLYCFTLVAIAASFTRTAGNLMFPVLMALAYFMVRGRIIHYVLCILLFSLGAGIYQWHRYEIFDMRNHPNNTSSKGFQLIYPNYLYLRDFGLSFSSDFGPNTKLLLEKLRNAMGTNVRDSVLIRNSLGETPANFMEKNVYAYTPEQLMEKITKEPNEEYYYILLGVAENDQLLLDVAKEIMHSHPWYVVKYTARNMRHALFSPGYASTRYNTLGYGHTGNEFMPATQGWGTRSEDPVVQYGLRAEREMQYFPLETAPRFVKHIFSGMKKNYLHYFDKYVWITSVLMILAWLSTGLWLISQLFSRAPFQFIKNIGMENLIAPIFVASALVVYEGFLTSIFCQPVYRYFHLTEPLRMVVAGLGMVVAVRLISRFINFNNPLSKVVVGLQKHDLFDYYFTNRRNQWIILLISVNILLFAWWVASMLTHT